MFALALGFVLWVLYTPVVLTLEALSIPLAIVFGFTGAPKLFGTPDNPDEGDAGHQARWAGKSKYWQRVAWLCRNRAYGWKLYVFGVQYSEEYKTLGNPKIKNRDDAIAGWCIRYSGWKWYCKCVIPYGTEKCIQLGFGWQLDAEMHNQCIWMFSPRSTGFYPA